MLSVNGVYIVICKQVDVSLLPAEPMLSWKEMERRVVKALKSDSSGAAQCKMMLVQSVSAAQKEVLTFNFVLLWSRSLIMAFCYSGILGS